MEIDKIEEILLELKSDTTYIKAKMEVVEEFREDLKEVNRKVDVLEAENSELKKSARVLEHRCDVVEEYIRDEMTNSNRESKKVIGATVLAVFTAVLSFLVSLF